MEASQTILWVDDDSDFVQDVLAVWHPAEAVTNVATCSDARRELAEHRPALVIIDLDVSDPELPTVPDCGLRLIEQIRRSPEADIPVLVITSEERPSLLYRAAGLGAFAILPKRKAIAEIAGTAERLL